MIIKYLVENTDKVLLNETTNRLNGRNSTGTNCTGKSLSEALIFVSTNPQYDDRLFIELHVQYMKIPSSNLGRTCCVHKLFWMS